MAIINYQLPLSVKIYLRKQQIIYPFFKSQFLKLGYKNTLI